MKIIYIIFFFLIFTYRTFSTPEISLWTNNRCSKCHINTQGGGARNGFAKNFGKEASVISTFKTEKFTANPNSISSAASVLSDIYNVMIQEVNKKPDSLLTLGFDFRMQSARSHKTENSIRKFFPMQGSLYISSNPIESVVLEGQYNLGPIIFQGQKNWSASLILQAIEYKYLPKIRLGFFQPTIGIRDCDMTGLDRRIPFPDGSEVLISTDFAELGGELIFEPNEWFSLHTGIFDSKSLSEVLIGSNQSMVSAKNNPSFSSRAVFYPSWFFDDFPDSHIGISALVNGDFKYLSAFSGIAIEPEIHLYAKFNYSNKPLTLPYQRTSTSYIFGTTYIPYKGIFLGARAEFGNTEWLYPELDKYNINTKQFVINAKVILIPFFEIIPEYRWLITEEFSSSRWTLQFHLFY
jgi:hypothetical protein